MSLPKTKRRKSAVPISQPGWKLYRDFYTKRWGITEEIG